MTLKGLIGGWALVSGTLLLVAAVSHSDCVADWPVSDQSAIGGFCQPNGVTCSTYQTPLMCHNVDSSTGWSSAACPNPTCDVSSCACAAAPPTCSVPAGTNSGFGGGAPGACAAWEYQVSQGCDGSGNVIWGSCGSNCSAFVDGACGGSGSYANGSVNCPGQTLQTSSCSRDANPADNVMVAQCGAACSSAPSCPSSVSASVSVSPGPYQIGTPFTVSATGMDPPLASYGLSVDISGPRDSSAANTCPNNTGLCVITYTPSAAGTYTFSASASLSSCGLSDTSAPITVVVSPSGGCPVISGTSYCQSSGCLTGCTIEMATSGSMMHRSDGSGAPFYAGDSVDIGGSGVTQFGTVDSTNVSVDVCAGKSSCFVMLPAGTSYIFNVTVSSLGVTRTDPYTFPVVSAPVTVSASASPTTLAPGQTTATLSAAASGGSGSYTYLWTLAGGSSATVISNSNSASTTVTLPQQGGYSFMVTVTDSHGQTASAIASVIYPVTIASTINVGTPSNDSVWMASASSGTAQVDVVATVDPALAGWTVAEVDYQIPCGTGGSAMQLVSGFTDTYAPASTINLSPGSYSACVTATATDGQGHTIINSSPARNIYVFLQPTATITPSCTVCTSTAPISVTVSGDYSQGGATYPGQTVGSVAVFVDGQSMNNAAGTSQTFSFSLSTGPHSLSGFVFDGTIEPGSTPPQQSRFPSLAASVGILVVPTFNPSIVISTPAFGTRVLAGTSVSFVAQASAVQTRTIHDVAFYLQGTGLIADVFQSPYQTVWHAPAAGLYQFSAGATDNTGLSFGTPWLTINVDSPPVVSIVNPIANDVLLSGSSTTVKLNAADPNSNGAIAEVDLYVDNIYVDSATWVGSSSYTYVWTPNVSGTHFLKAQATDTYGWTTVSSQVLVQISTGGAIAPFITHQPSSTTVRAGQSAGFSVSAVGVPSPSYQWQVNSGSGFSNIANATSASYFTPPLALADSGWQYQCIVSNSAGSLTTLVVTLTVTPASTLNLAMQAAGPVAVGQTATFQLSASGGVPPYTYKWQTALPGSSTWTSVANAFSAAYTMTASSFSDNGMQFRGQVTDSQPAAPQSTFSVAGILSVPHLTLVSSPISLTIVTPSMAGFTTLVNYGMPPYHYRWQRSTSAGGSAFADIAGAADAAYYSFTATDATYNQFAFQCIATDANGDSVTTVPSVLSIIVPRAGDDAQIDSFLAIPPLAAGTNNYGSVVQFRNIGFNAWTSTGGYVLAVQNPSNNMTWGYAKVSLNPGEIVLPGGTRDFLLSVPAPTAAGSYPFYWQMQHNGQFFGPVAGQQVVVVSLAAIPNVLPSNGEISLPLGTSGSVNFSVFGNVPGTNMASFAGAPHAASLGAPMASMTLPAGQTLDLASLHLSPGDYLLQVIMTDANGLQSPPVSKALTIVQPGVNSIRVYPNPWRADQDAGVPITFDNLTLSSTVKLFTVSGRWVETLPMTNDKITWDLKNHDGELVQSGLYLYLVTDAQGGKAHGKLAIIR